MQTYHYAAACLLLLLLGGTAPVDAQISANLLEERATVHALTMATPLGEEQPQGDVEEISCTASLICGQCHALSPEFIEAADLDYSWIDPSTCKAPEVRAGTGGGIWMDGITVMSDTLDSVRGAVLYLRDFAPDEYRLPENLLALHDLSFSLSRLPLVTRGTSAGLAFLLSAYSAVTGTDIMPQVAVTGAVDQHGIVGPVGSVIQKILAADRLGYSTVIIPAGNASALSLLPPELPQRIRIILAETTEQALFHALGQAGPKGEEYEAMYQNYLAASSLALQGDADEALEIFSQLAALFPEDYSLRVWMQYLSS